MFQLGSELRINVRKLLGCCICTAIGLFFMSALFGLIGLIECNDDEDCESAVFMMQLYLGLGMAFYAASIIVNCASMIFGCNLRSKLEKGVVLVVQPGAPPTTAQPVGAQTPNPKFDPETGQPIQA